MGFFRNEGCKNYDFVLFIPLKSADIFYLTIHVATEEALFNITETRI